MASNEAITATAGPEHAGGLAGRGHPGRRRRLDQAAQARRLARDDRHRLAFAADHAAVDPRLAQLDGRVVDQVAGLEVVGAVEDQVGVADQVEDVGVIQVGDDRLDRRSSC